MIFSFNMNMNIRKGAKQESLGLQLPPTGIKGLLRLSEGTSLPTLNGLVG